MPACVHPSREEGRALWFPKCKGRNNFQLCRKFKPTQNPSTCVSVGVCVSALLNGKKQGSFSFIFFFVRAFGDGFAPEEKNTFHSLYVGSSSTANSGGNVTAISRLCVCVCSLRISHCTRALLESWLLGLKWICVLLPFFFCLFPPFSKRFAPRRRGRFDEG